MLQWPGTDFHSGVWPFEGRVQWVSSYHTSIQRIQGSGARVVKHMKGNSSSLDHWSEPCRGPVLTNAYLHNLQLIVRVPQRSAHLGSGTKRPCAQQPVAGLSLLEWAPTLLTRHGSTSLMPI